MKKTNYVVIVPLTHHWFISVLQDSSVASIIQEVFVLMEFSHLPRDISGEWKGKLFRADVMLIQSRVRHLIIIRIWKRHTMSFSCRGRDVTQASARERSPQTLDLPEGGGGFPACLPACHTLTFAVKPKGSGRRYQWSWLMPTWGSLIYYCDSGRKSTLAKMIHAAWTINLFPRCFLNTRAPLTFMLVTGVSICIGNKLSFSLHSLGIEKK